MDKYQIDAPFSPQVFEDVSGGLFPGSLESYQRSHDQRFRYPTDTNGHVFKESGEFDAIAYQAAIQKFHSQVCGMVARIEFDWWSY